MSRLERSLRAKTIPLTGDIALRAELTFRIQSNAPSRDPFFGIINQRGLNQEWPTRERTRASTARVRLM